MVVQEIREQAQAAFAGSYPATHDALAEKKHHRLLSGVLCVLHRQLPPKVNTS